MIYRVIRRLSNNIKLKHRIKETKFYRSLQVFVSALYMAIEFQTEVPEQRGQWVSACGSIGNNIMCEGTALSV